jgi:alanine racemase
VSVGDRAVLFGPGDHGEPTAQDWADELETIHYEVVTGVHGRRVQRTVVEGAGPEGSASTGGASTRPGGRT